jgi:hypothetical protein
MGNYPSPRRIDRADERATHRAHAGLGRWWECSLSAREQPARYVAVKTKSGAMVHEATLYRSLETIAKAGIKAEVVAGSFPWGEAG